MERDHDTSLRGLGSAIRLTIEKNQIGERLRPHRALALWPEVAGEQIAAVAAADAVRGGVLFVRVKSSVWASELTFYKPDLLRRLNQRLGAGSGGAEVIQEIHFSTASRATRSRAGGAGGGEAAAALRAKSAAAKVELRDLSRVAPPVPAAALDDPQFHLESLVARTRSVLAWKRANGWIECSRCSALYEPRAGRRSAAPVCPVCRTLMNR